MLRFLKKIWYLLQRKHICEECNKAAQYSFLGPYLEEGEKKLPTFHFCQDHASRSGWCLGCGFFCGGIESFDFSEIAAFCEQCVDEIKTDCGEYDDYGDELDYFDPYEEDYEQELEEESEIE